MYIVKSKAGKSHAVRKRLHDSRLLRTASVTLGLGEEVPYRQYMRASLLQQISSTADKGVVVVYISLCATVEAASPCPMGSAIQVAEHPRCIWS